jgi:hypothetical protein
MEERRLTCRGKGLAATFLIWCLLGSVAQAQQILVMKKGEVTARINPGDELLFVFKDDKQVNHVTIQSIREFYFITTSKDTIPYQRVGKLVYRSPERRKRGVVMIASGAALLAVYGINSLAFDVDTPSMRGLRLVGFLGVGFGSLLCLTANSSTKLSGARRLKYASYDSPLYR